MAQVADQKYYVDVTITNLMVDEEDQHIPLSALNVQLSLGD
jgi:hypothetical protein